MNFVFRATAFGGLIFALSSPASIGKQINIFRSWQAWYKSQTRQKQYRIRKTFEQLRRERLLDITETKSGETRMILSDKGQKKILEYKFEEMKIKIPDRWDGYWRMIIFDIPEHLKTARNALRTKLNELGFHQLQKSVWIHPYECRDEINFIIEFFNIRPYVKMAEATQFDGDDLIKDLLLAQKDREEAPEKQ